MNATARQQPLPTIDVVRATMPEYMLKLAEVEALVGRKKTWIYAEIKAGRFPAPDDGRWYASEIAGHLAAGRLARVQGVGQDGGG